MYVDGAEASYMFLLVSSGKSKGADRSPTLHNGVSVLWKDLTEIQQLNLSLYVYVLSATGCNIVISCYM